MTLSGEIHQRSGLIRRLGVSSNFVLGFASLNPTYTTWRPKRLMSHYGIGYLRFNWIYDVAGDEWQDNMSGPVISLWEIRTLADQPEHR